MVLRVFSLATGFSKSRYVSNICAIFRPNVPKMLSYSSISLVCPMAANACLESTCLLNPLISTNWRAVAMAPEETITMSYSFLSSTICRAMLSITANDIRLVPAVSVEVPIFIISFFFISASLSCIFYSLICPFPYTNHLLVTSSCAPSGPRK